MIEEDEPATVEVQEGEAEVEEGVVERDGEARGLRGRHDERRRGRREGATTYLPGSVEREEELPARRGRKRDHTVKGELSQRAVLHHELPNRPKARRPVMKQEQPEKEVFIPRSITVARLAKSFDVKLCELL